MVGLKSEKMKGKGPKLKENMFPMMVLKKLLEDEPLPTQSFFEDYDKTCRHSINVIPRDIDKWRLESVRLRLRQMKFRGLVNRLGADLWTITPLGVAKLKKKGKEKINN